MLALCPPAHHELFRLKRLGLTLSEIASRTGLHPSSVRRILYELARRYAEAQARAVPTAGNQP
jgi:RNA polymerase sigma-70 factor (ECF subfamily)